MRGCFAQHFAPLGGIEQVGLQQRAGKAGVAAARNAHDRLAAGRQQVGDGAADAARGAGDQCVPLRPRHCGRPPAMVMRCISRRLPW
ncbi:Uncharacterised protein [Bordetella pertussis]|nr:Uncharacterised protein [Bordetella pertussis]